MSYGYPSFNDFSPDFYPGFNSGPYPQSYTPRTTRNRLKAIASRRERDGKQSDGNFTDPYRQKLFGLNLKLISSLNDVTEIPIFAKSTIIIADVDHVLYFRVFNADGKAVVDTSERELPDKAREIAAIRSQLETLWPPQEPDKREKVQIIPAIASLVGYTESTPVKSGGGSVSTRSFATDNPDLYARARAEAARIANDPTIQLEKARFRESAGYYGDVSVGR
ncbi:hypothetical protein [Singulisphaera sp. PoT]|uniref:hypothetical protein n=1 Tax=Singulisphaera sp. PoT TaxID=3411797 RepID=UPI003BF49596